jgi:PPOX class probable F420-dependent enzyme
MTPSERLFLETARVGHLATVDRLGRPHVVPVCYALLDGALYTPLDEKPKRSDPGELRRVRNIAANPAVCLTVDRYDEDWARLAWLQVRGRAGLVEAPAERERAIAALRARYPQYKSMALESRPLIRIDPTRLVAWSAGS